LTRNSRETPGSHHLDNRAADLILAGAGNPDDLLTTQEVAAWFRLSMQWLEIGRCKGWGPPFIKLSPRMVRYKRSVVLTYLEKRMHASTADYRRSRRRRSRSGEARA
jgi:hypothetical protein